MTSTRIILVFLGSILLLILLLSSNQLSQGIRKSVTNFLPMTAPSPTTTPSPTPTRISPSPTKSIQQPFKKPTAANIPATGPEELVWIVIGVCGLGGVLLRKYSR